MNARHLVVVSFYEPRPGRPLEQLLESLRAHDAGLPYDLVVVLNRTDTGRLPLPAGTPLPEVLQRPNEGMNIGAWDHAWRARPGYEGYLFLQDECSAVARGWLSAFVEAGEREDVGLVGESWNAGWDREWSRMREAVAGHTLREHLIEGQPANRADAYRHFLQRHGVEPGARAGHLRSLVWYARRATLERMGGFLHGANYGECIAAEIAATKQVEQLGLRAVQVGQQPFSCFRHAEWSEVAPGQWRHGAQPAGAAKRSAAMLFARTRARLGSMWSGWGQS